MPFNLSIVNVVVTSSLGQRIDFAILKQYPEIIYDNEVYGGLVAYYKKYGMVGRITIFASGKLISVGTKSVNDAINELKLLMEFLVKKGQIKSVNLQFKVQNIVAKADVGKIDDFGGVVNSFGLTYDPQQFPGAIYKLGSLDATILLFSSGKIIITGLKKETQVKDALNEVLKIISTK